MLASTTTIQAQLGSYIVQGFQQLYGLGIASPSLQPTRPEFDGDLTLVVFPFTKETQQKPEALGEALGSYLLQHCPMVARYQVVKGFLNLALADAVWLEAFAQVHASTSYGQLPPSGQRVMVEYSSPNTNKPLHLGHMRNNFLGYATAQLLKAAGTQVTMVNLVNDRGIHICKSMLAYQLHGQGETPESSGLKGDHLIGKYYVRFEKELKAQAQELEAAGHNAEYARENAPLMQQARAMLQAWEAKDPETIALWEKMNAWVYAGFRESYQRMGVAFDHWYYESQTYLLGKELVQEGLDKGVFFTKPDGSVWIDLSEEGLDEKLVLRADGTSVYITQDLGTADQKFQDFPFDGSIYVVADEQDYHFKVLFSILKKLGRPYAQGLHHLSYGMVDLPTGRMKSREGTVVDADDLMDEMVQTARARTYDLGKIEGFDEAEQQALYETLGLGAIKYYLLRVEPRKRMTFNPEESIDMHGNTATSIQYTYARIRSVQRKAADSGLVPQVPTISPHAAERDLMKHLLSYPPTVQQAALAYSPSQMCTYLYDLSRLFNSFFAELSILKAEEPDAVSFRLALCQCTAHVLQHGLGLLGIAVPERM